MNIGDRSRIRLLDKLAKSNGWRSLCIVGVKDDLEAKSLIQWCRQLDVTVVWRQRQEAHRAEKQRQVRSRDRMRHWTGVYKRFTLVEDEDALTGQQFDAVALWGMKPAELAKDGAAWAALVRDGGMLVGTDHRLPECRGVLGVAVAEWRKLRDGVWLVEVKRSAESDAVSEVGNIGSGDIAELGEPGVIADGDEISAIVGAEELAQSRKLQRRSPASRKAQAAGLADAVDPALTVGGSELHAETVSQPAPKRRGGRPKGSRNKPKVTAE